jgi:hypothetical protein
MIYMIYGTAPSSAFRRERSQAIQERSPSTNIYLSSKSILTNLVIWSFSVFNVMCAFLNVLDKFLICPYAYPLLKNSYPTTYPCIYSLGTSLNVPFMDMTNTQADKILTDFNLFDLARG